MIKTAIKKAKNETNLAKFLKISRGKVNTLRNGRVPIKLGDLKRLCDFLGIEFSSLSIRGFSTRKGSKLNLQSILEISKEIAWLLGIRMGDRDEDHYTVGIGTSDVENALEFIDCICNVLNLSRDTVHCYASIPNPKKSDNEYQSEFAEIMQIPPENIHTKPPHVSQRHKKIHFTMKLFNSIASALFKKLDDRLERILIESSDDAKFAFIRGIIDSDGRVRKWGSVEIEMRTKNLKKLKIIRSILRSLNLDTSKLHHRKQRNTISLTIHATKKNKEVLWKNIGSTLPRKMVLLENAYLHPGLGCK
jgi:DNA-binding Xre family transcriptional regulator/intein/homing endonuclease